SSKPLLFPDFFSTRRWIGNAAFPQAAHGRLDSDAQHVNICPLPEQMLVPIIGRISMKLTPILVGAFTLALAASASAQTLTIATVNNGDMIRMQGLSSAFT